jgi:hypothetical protein
MVVAGLHEHSLRPEKYRDVQQLCSTATGFPTADAPAIRHRVVARSANIEAAEWLGVFGSADPEPDPQKHDYADHTNHQDNVV